MKLRKHTGLILVALVACIDPISLPVSDFPPQLVVDGMITDQPGPYTVKLFTTKALNDQISNPSDVKNATVTIEVSDGTSEVLLESQPGNYVTKNLQGAVGKTYVLKISTADGLKYESEPEKLVGTGNIRNVTYSFELNEDPKKSNHLTTKNGFQIYVDSDVLAEQEGRVRWRTTKTFEIFAHPELKTRYLSLKDGSSVLIPAVPTCGALGHCTCCECWITDFVSLPVLSKASTTTNSVNKMPVEFIPASRRIFNQKCIVEVEQLSISESVYQFWSGIAQQKKTSSDLFQTPMPRTGGNIKTLSPNAASAIGVFAASSIRKKSITILRSEIPYTMPGIDTLKDSCLTFYTTSTTVRPSFW